MQEKSLECSGRLGQKVCQREGSCQWVKGGVKDQEFALELATCTSLVTIRVSRVVATEAQWEELKREEGEKKETSADNIYERFSYKQKRAE